MPGLIFDQPPQGQLMTGFVSKHFGGGEYNDSNHGLGYRTPDGWMFGAYKNSINKPSTYIAKEFTTDAKNVGNVKFRWSLAVGAVTGYGRHVLPVVMPGFQVTLGDVTLATGLIPPTSVTPLTLAFQLRKAL